MPHVVLVSMPKSATVFVTQTLYRTAGLQHATHSPHDPIGPYRDELLRYVVSQ